MKYSMIFLCLKLKHISFLFINMLLKNNLLAPISKKKITKIKIKILN